MAGAICGHSRLSAPPTKSTLVCAPLASLLPDFAGSPLNFAQDASAVLVDRFATGMPLDAACAKHRNGRGLHEAKAEGKANGEEARSEPRVS